MTPEPTREISRSDMEGVPYLELDAAQIAAMKAEYGERGVSACPLCGEESQPWGGMWFCVCGAIACG